ncbi:MAG TPA: hypothetical protein VLA76_10720 [Candidatus Angelobacter sp.]|nr:hypothetical protein [Candidatus Angelobacter sp.]
MRRWWSDAVVAADLVAGRAGLWLPGALAWVLTVGWLPLLVAVGRAPTAADLTFLGARLYTSGAWPWNAAVVAAGAFGVTAAAIGLVAVAEAILVARRPGLSFRTVTRVTAIGVVTAAPAIAVVIAGAAAFVIVALGEFNAPGAGDPVWRALSTIAPFALPLAAAWAGGAAAHAVAVREAALGRAGIGEALAAIPRRLRGAGAAGVLAATSGFLAALASAVVAAVLLRVLWAPIEARLAVDGPDLAVAPLLVGFVGIWLCLVLGGGALHAWASVTWTRVLAPAGRTGDEARWRSTGEPHRP